jgi:hypothetical protein
MQTIKILSYERSHLGYMRWQTIARITWPQYQARAKTIPGEGKTWRAVMI